MNLPNRVKSVASVGIKSLHLVAVAHEKYFYHYIFPPEILQNAQFCGLFLKFPASHTSVQILENYAKCSNSQPSVVIKCSHLVVNLGALKMAILFLPIF